MIPLDEIQIMQLLTILRETRPHLMVIEDAANKLGYGEIDLKMSVRNGVVQKIQFFESRTWMRDKEPSTN